MAKTTFQIPLSFQNRLFGFYVNQIAQQRQMLQNVRKGLPDNLAKHACHCLVSNGTLLLFTDSAIWASQLRFYNKAILANIAPVTQEIVQKMQIKVMTQSTGTSPASVVKVKIPTVATIELMKKQTACVNDKPLQQSLLRLNATLRRLAEAGR